MIFGCRGFGDCFRIPKNHILKGWSGGALVLGKLPVTGRPTILMIVGQGLIALAVGADGGCLDILLSSILSLFLRGISTEILSQRAANPKQPTNQP